MKNLLSCLLVFAAVSAPLAHAATSNPAKFREPSPASNSLVRVNSTNQAHDFLRPWTKKPPFTRKGIGVVVGPNQVLVTAELVANHNFIELERPDSGARSVAALEFIDYDANLALLKGEDPAFLKDSSPVKLAATAQVGEVAKIVQIESNGIAAETDARLTTITTMPYLAEDSSLLVFRLSAPIQQREGSFVLPAFRGSELLGILMRYDSRNQTADVIPGPVISRFLEQAREGKLTAFPRAGISFATLRDPGLRKYLGLENNGGVFLGNIQPGSAAEKSGLQKGDVLLQIDSHKIDADGNIEHPDFGRISLGYLISTAANAGDKLRFRVHRDGKAVELPVQLERQSREAMAVPPYLFDQQPRYLILGGMVFREMNRAYLQEWGPDWRSSAPQRLVAADLFQHESDTPNQKVVFLSHVIPTPATLGYENFSDTIIEAVDGEPVSTLEELQQKLTKDLPGIRRIDLKGDPGWLFLDPASFEGTGEILKREYGIDRLHNLD